MYEINLIYNDFKKYQIQIEDDDIDQFVECLEKAKPFHNKDKKIGFFVHYSVLKAAYFQYKEAPAASAKEEVAPQEINLPKEEPKEAEPVQDRESPVVEIPPAMELHKDEMEQPVEQGIPSC